MTTASDRRLCQAALEMAKEAIEDLELISVAEYYNDSEFTDEELVAIHRLAITATPTIN